MANTLNLFRNGAVGFIDLLGGTVPSRDSGSALLLVKRGSHDVPIESTEANEVSEGRTTRSAIVACELADLLLIFVLLALFPPNETELSHRWREREWQTSRTVS